MAVGPRRSEPSVRRPRREPVGPWGRYVNDVLVRKGLSYKRAYEPIDRTAHDDGEPYVNYGRHSIRNWIGGVLPHADALRWIATGWDEPLEKVSARAEAHRDWRYEQRVRAAGRDPLAQQPAEPPAPAPSALQPVCVTRVSWPSTSEHSADYPSGTDWPAWFGLRLAHVLGVITDWEGSISHVDSLQALLHQQIMMFEAAEPGDPRESILYAHSRRQALIALASLPLVLTASRKATRSTVTLSEALLADCAASLTACWHLLKGADLCSVDRTLSTYLVPLGSIAQRPSAHQQPAARLASQAHRICGIVALHHNDLKVRERHCQQAVHYASIAADPSAEVSALISLGSTHFYGNDPQQAATAYERALVHQSAIPSLQNSRLYAELAAVYGQLSREQDALRSLGNAEQLYPGQPEQDRSFLYAEFTPASLALERGLAYLALAEQYPDRGYERTAMDAFTQVERATVVSAPDRIRCEIINHQAAAAILLNDVDAFEAYLTLGIEGAQQLRSRQRRQETLTTWRRALHRWPREQRLTNLSERFPHLLRRQSAW